MLTEMSALVGVSLDALERYLPEYARAKGGIFEVGTPAVAALEEEGDVYALGTLTGGPSAATVQLPAGFCTGVGGEQLSRNLSRHFQGPVFHFVLADFWCFVLFDKGEEVSRYHPMPAHWEAHGISFGEGERRQWKCEPEAVARAGRVTVKDVECYLVPWDEAMLQGEEQKAYPGDLFPYGPAQFLDFMRKLGLPCPYNEDGTPSGKRFRLEVPAE
jgi:hypothetical protein